MVLTKDLIKPCRGCLSKQLQNSTNCEMNSLIQQCLLITHPVMSPVATHHLKFGCKAVLPIDVDLKSVSPDKLLW